MIKKFKNWIKTKPDKMSLAIYFGLYFIYWFIMWFIWDAVILREYHNIFHYLFYGLWMSIGWLLFNKWDLIKSCFNLKK